MLLSEVEVVVIRKELQQQEQQQQKQNVFHHNTTKLWSYLKGKKIIKKLLNPNNGFVSLGS